MAAVGSRYSNDDDLPTATLAPPSASRRLPPPCWTADEIVALIDAYQEKWYSLQRGNLRANHWQEVADDLATRCCAAPPKTAVQCRHKMEKLRKRYRSEIQRASAHGGVRRYSSSWAHFLNMHSMETGATNNPTPPSSDDDSEEEDRRNSIKRINDLYSYSNNQKGIFGNQLPEMDRSATPGVRIKIPGGVTVGHHPSKTKVYCKFEDVGGQKARSPASVYGPEISRTKKVETVVSDVVAAIESLGEGFIRIEKAKMDMAQQVEEMRMDMELKRTEMLLESHQRIVSVFANAITERSSKKVKRMPIAPDC